MRTTLLKLRWFFYDFADSILLYNDVPIEIVSKLLGNSSIKTT